MKHLKPLTSLRFFAAFVVVLCHLRYTHYHQLPAWAWNFCKNGFVGVNLFFVLSGFVITYNYGEKFLEKTTTFRDFMIARFARIWPAFVTALILALPFYVWGVPEAMRKFPMMLPVHLLLIHNWFPNLGASWLSPSWTIGTEWGFYLMFPFFAAEACRLRERGLWILLFTSAALTFVAPVVYHSGLLSGVGLAEGGGLGGEDFVGRVLRWYSIFRLPEFLVGVAVCRLFMLQRETQRDRWARIMGPIAAISLVAVLWLMLWDPLPLMFMNQAILTLPFAAILWFLAYDRGLVARWMSVPFLVLLGEASYSLYLVHIIVKQVAMRAWWYSFHLGADSFISSELTIVAAIAVSIFIYKKIERPSRKWIIDRFGRRKPEASHAAPAFPEPERASEPAAL